MDAPRLQVDEPGPALLLERDSLGQFAAASRREWLVTNGLGGYASGTVAGANTRRYHGLLVGALHPPLGRTVMVAGMDVFAHYGERRFALSTQEYAGGTIEPTGYRNLLSFRLEGQIPVWTWLLGEALLEQRIWMEQEHNVTYLQWTLLRAVEAVALEVLPLCTWRDYHWQHRGRRDPQLRQDAAQVEVIAFNGAAPYRLIAERGDCRLAYEWYWNFHHRVEAERGLDADEDLFRPATFGYTLQPGQSCALVLTADTDAPVPAAASLSRARQRQEQLLRAARQTSPALRLTAARSIEPLVLAADQFIVARHEHGRAGGRSVIAGYPWFGDWGRDTMIALPGLTLGTGRAHEAADILRTFARHVSQGMLPNRFPDDGQAPEYNTADATLWYVIAIHETMQSTRDAGLRRDLYPVLKDIIGWHLRGTRYGIAVDTGDGLLRAGAAGVQLTWMDVKVGDWVVTPRIGKPVEINALWINALRIVAQIASDEGDVAAALQCTALADQATASFSTRFWNASAGCLFDVIDTPDGPADASLRPNQIFALSLPHALLDGAQARAVLATCLRELWTPVGLRSLATQDAQYVGRYAGGPAARDAVYHQGTVWSWLLGPLAIAHWRVYRDRVAAANLLAGLLPHLREACVGQISEIFDGDAPFAPVGCFAQAWSVAETLRAWSEIHASEPASC